MLITILGLNRLRGARKGFFIVVVVCEKDERLQKIFVVGV